MRASPTSPNLDTLPARLWVLAGPTACGKTAVGLELAERLPRLAAPAAGVEIISADARQIYQGMAVGAAQPSAAQRRRVRHHLVDCVDPLELYTAASFARDGRAVLAELAARRVLPLIAGGSGLYLRALVDGLFEGPGQQPELRAQLEARAAQAGDAALHRELERRDPSTAARLHPHDRVRVIRALEVAIVTGTPLSEHHRRQPRAGSLAPRTCTVVLERDREDLGARIAARTAAMFEDGIIEEAQALLARGLGPEHPVYRTVGYAQTFALLRGEMTRAEAIEATCVATRRYARRQRIWFRALPAAVGCRIEGDEAPAATAARIVEMLIAREGERPGRPPAD